MPVSFFFFFAFSIVDLLDLLLDNCDILDNLRYFLDVSTVEMPLVPMVQSVDSDCSLR